MASLASVICEPTPPARKAFGAALLRDIWGKPDNPNGAGTCWHCGEHLDPPNVKPRRWDADHFPIPYRDIKDQLCCGVTDQHDVSNLVPACRSCNRSHMHEPTTRWIYCGRTQWCCLRSAMRTSTLVLAGAVAGACITALVIVSL